LESDGVNFNRFRDELRNEILITRLKEREVDSKILITDAEIDNYLKTQQNLGGKDDEYSLAHILVLVPSRPARSKSRPSALRRRRRWRNSGRC